MGPENHWLWLHTQLCAPSILVAATGDPRRADVCGAHGSRGVMDI